MKQHAPTERRDRGTSRDRMLSLVTLLLATGIALLSADWILGWYDARIAASSEMDPGLLRYQPELGWTLTPYWRGRHQHHDFEVTYAVNSAGFRGVFPTAGAPKTGARVAILGDSFTFGLGVDDDQTFVSALAKLGPSVEFLNFGVPGYSTDQELLMLDAQVFPHAPDAVWLAFYLGNDLLDNALDYPLQADQAKPFFERLDDGTLALRNVPVPRDAKPALARQRSIEDIVFGDALDDRRTVWNRLGGSSHLLGRLLPRDPVIGDHAFEAPLDARLAQQQLLLSALLVETAARVHANGADLVLIPLPGQSLIEQPRSAAAVFQNHVLRFVIREAERLGISLIDPVADMREACRESSAPCFHPHEGHFTAAGHAIVANFLWNAQKERAARGRPVSLVSGSGR